jgi:hypothetical protein
MKKRAAKRDQIPLRRPLFGVEPSGRNLISNRHANCKEKQISAIFIDMLSDSTPEDVKNSDTWRPQKQIPEQAIFL